MATADERIYDELTQTLLHPWRESKKRPSQNLNGSNPQSTIFGQSLHKPPLGIGAKSPDGDVFR